jgi:hypothetical protein
MIQEQAMGIPLLAIGIYHMYHNPPWVLFADLVTFMDFYTAITWLLVQLGLFIGALAYCLLDIRRILL